ncbi:MAG: 1-deoxy-D-xylulose-5-phosphate reductoisomerase [bacterium]
MRSLIILGSTGSIGESALRVVAALPDRLRVTGLATRTNVTRVLEQAKQFNVRQVAVGDPVAAAEARRLAPPGVRVLTGDEGVVELAGTAADADVVLCALVGMSGLRPVLAAMAAGHDVALATKEVLVAAGELVMKARARHHVRILPVDSEHSALFQCLQSPVYTPFCVRPADAPAAQAAETRVRQLLLTASGGPFASRPEIDLDRVTIQEALNHPRWSMGRKVTIDSATMMNKGLEIMEARWLFNVPLDCVDVVVHPESVVHSLVAFVDGAWLAQLSPPDMRFAIQYALTWPDRVAVEMPPLELSRLARLQFTAPDEQRFRCLRLARQAAAAGGTCPAVLNAANEIAVEAFLGGKITFSGIWQTVEQVLGRHERMEGSSLDEILAVDQWARTAAAQCCEV